MKKFHITYFIKDPETTSFPLLHGVTIEAESMIFALNKFLNTHPEISEDRVKYIIQL